MQQANIEYAILMCQPEDNRGVLACVGRYLFKFGASLHEEFGRVNGTVGSLDVTFSAPVEAMERIKRRYRRDLAFIDAKLVPTTAPVTERRLLYGLDVYADDVDGIGCEIKTRILKASANILEVYGRRYAGDVNGPALYHGHFILKFDNVVGLHNFRKCTKDWIRTKGWEVELYVKERARRTGPVVVVNTQPVIGSTKMPHHRRNF